ncbi:MAG: thrombospondin type 3 repeat-containing protein, partial [Gammaproteobacteria bacterium]|nr:thrombospondin type 3 repeat-containing protein [Gammaproteobacteria bacterium]
MERLFGVLRRKWWAVCVILLPLAACSVPGGDGIVGTGFTVRGSSNKGPFIQGAEVVVHSLTPSGERTRETRKAEIDNEHGGFKFTANTTGAVLIVSNGAHLNEVNGMWSKNWVSLRAVQTVSPAHGIRTNVNILTHFGYKYILKQMAQGVDVDLARTLAQKRVLEMLNEIVAVQDADFGAGDNAATAERRVKGDAFLVVLSATLQRYAMERFSVNPRSSVDAQFNFLLNKIAALVSDDKPLPTDMLAGLKLASRRLRPDLIRENLIGRGLWPEEFSVHASNPLDLFIDTDADGLVNAVDTDIDGDGILNESDTRTYIADGAPLVRLK